ncbi:uncharacterized protein TRUGW13939_05877 [Talaromyces rugulosus]|uniref:ABM domain-containing protein n=1 Tax=Talaromyces rugulosus TaxID=121627 RepID=A0A7H8QXC9_TALRU|nr:uncharacterized protein TRUGW13939_05877 [Talaromyces rugulosus]QKX58750.1 hypothetical protein TRUGW13939_05877 [Talaromyces rugulosus]
MSSDAIHNIVTLIPKSGKFNDLLQAFDKLAQYVQANEPETLFYYAVQPKSKDHIIIVEKYENVHALKTHAQSAPFKEFGKAIQGLVQAPPDIKTCIFATGFDIRPKI